MTKNKMMILIIFAIGCILFLVYTTISNQEYTYLMGVVSIIIILFLKKTEYDKDKENFLGISSLPIFNYRKRIYNRD
ncbi:hypothetical protein Q73_05965 [Bacillus coahuilensis m2-6]|nr:hypothetical protein Q73_05965 [Bacillus coahuilensis m2-6]